MTDEPEFSALPAVSTVTAPDGSTFRLWIRSPDEPAEHEQRFGCVGDADRHATELRTRVERGEAVTSSAT